MNSFDPTGLEGARHGPASSETRAYLHDNRGTCRRSHGRSAAQELSIGCRPACARIERAQALASIHMRFSSSRNAILSAVLLMNMPELSAKKTITKREGGRVR